MNPMTLFKGINDFFSFLKKKGRSEKKKKKLED